MTLRETIGGFLLAIVLSLPLSLMCPGFAFFRDLLGVEPPRARALPRLVRLNSPQDAVQDGDGLQDVRPPC